MGSPNHYSKAAARKLGFRSGFEVAFSKELEAIGVKHEYESDKCVFNYFKPVVKGGLLDKKGNPLPPPAGSRIVQWKVYTCDFVLFKPDGSLLYIETKGRFMSSDRSKHRLLKKQFPDVDLRILFSDNGKVSAGTRNMDWAAKYDIPAALIVKPTKTRSGKYIPREWLSECNIEYQH